MLAGGGGEVPHLISDCCGACEACVATARGAHPDVFVLMPEIEAIARKLVAKADLEASPSRDLRIGQVRELQARVELKASHGRRKVALVLVADALNEQAQNALLKTLEEPPPNTCIVLVTSAPDQLLPTVRSRCLRVNFGPLPLAEVASRVAAARGLDADTARLYAALAAGSLGRALAIDPKDVERRRASVLAEQAADAAPDDRARLDLAEALAERDLAAAALNAWESFYRDAAVLASGAPEPQLANPDFEAMARACAMRHGLSELLRRLAAFPAIRDALVHNGNVKLQLEALLLGFGGIR